MMLRIIVVHNSQAKPPPKQLAKHRLTVPKLSGSVQPPRVCYYLP